MAAPSPLPSPDVQPEAPENNILAVLAAQERYVLELKEELGNLRKEAFNLRFQKAGGQLGKTGRVRQVRRDIARIKTVLGEKSAG